MAHGGKREKLELLALELAGGSTVRAAAARIGVSERSCHRWNSRPVFRARVSELRASMVGAAAGRLSSEMGRAVDTLVLLLADADPRVRLGAAREILASGLRVHETVELEARIRALEGGA